MTFSRVIYNWKITNKFLHHFIFLELWPVLTLNLYLANQAFPWHHTTVTRTMSQLQLQEILTSMLCLLVLAREGLETLLFQFQLLLGESCKSHLQLFPSPAIIKHYKFKFVTKMNVILTCVLQLEYQKVTREQAFL